MNTYDEHFLNVFNEHYPFERYIVKEPKSIDNLFDDALLTEVFVPHTEIVAKTDSHNMVYWTSINKNEVYVKLKIKDTEVRLGYFDFEEHIRENIRHIIYEDFGCYEWECLYVDYDDLSDLNNLLDLQKKMITDKYGKCEYKFVYERTN